MKPSSMNDLVLSEFKEMLAMFIKDFDAMSDESLVYSPNPSVRTTYDFMYEIIVVNERMQVRVEGGDPGPWPYEGFLRAPETFCVREEAKRLFVSSNDSLLTAIQKHPETEWFAEIPTAQGSTSVANTLLFSLIHLCHHMGQMNYIQTLFGDDQMHWM